MLPLALTDEVSRGGTNTRAALVQLLHMLLAFKNAFARWSPCGAMRDDVLSP